MRFSDKKLVDVLHQDVFRVCESVDALDEFIKFASRKPNKPLLFDIDMVYRVLVLSLSDTIANKLHQISDKAIVSREEQVSLSAFIQRQPKPIQTRYLDLLEKINKKYSVTKKKLKSQRNNISAHAPAKNIPGISYETQKVKDFAKELKSLVELISSEQYSVGYLDQPDWGAGTQTRSLLRKMSAGDKFLRKEYSRSIIR